MQTIWFSGRRNQITALNGHFIEQNPMFSDFISYKQLLHFCLTKKNTFQLTTVWKLLLCFTEISFLLHLLRSEQENVYVEYALKILKAHEQGHLRAAQISWKCRKSWMGKKSFRFVSEWYSKTRHQRHDEKVFIVKYILG